MNDAAHTIEVPSAPVAQPRPRAAVIRGRPVLRQANADHPVHAWKATVRLAAERAVPHIYDQGEPLDVLVELWLPRPASHLKKSGGLRKGAPGFPGKPDLDNLAKSVLDALTGIVWKDDSQVVELRVRKAFAPAGGRPGARIELRVLEEQPG